MALSKPRIAGALFVTLGLVTGMTLLPTASAVAPSAPTECRASLLPLPARPQAARPLAPGITLRVWWTRQADAPAGVPARTRISAVQMRAGSGALSPATAGIPRLLHPAEPLRVSRTVAVVNGDYFSTMKQGDAVPEGALVVNGRPLYAPVGFTRVLAIDSAGVPRDARINVSAEVVSGAAKIRPRAINDPLAPQGKAVIFTDDWRRTDVPSGRTALVIRQGRVSKVVSPDKQASVPKGGYVVWTDQANAIERFPVGTPVQVRVGVVARDGLDVVSASGHGGALLTGGIVARECSAYENSLRPRTVIAWNARGDVWLLTASTGRPDPPNGVRMGGATKSQLAEVAKALGATSAVTMDGGGSTALYVAGGSGAQRIDLPQDAWARPLPVAWQISR